MRKKEFNIHDLPLALGLEIHIYNYAKLKYISNNKLFSMQSTPIAAHLPAGLFGDKKKQISFD